MRNWQVFHSLSMVAAAVVLVGAHCAPVAAQVPSKPITIVVPYAAGGGTDTVARLIADQMSKSLGQSVIVENTAGAGGTIANERVARSAPDGATLLINHVALLAAPSLFTNLKYDTDRIRTRRSRQQRAHAADRPQDNPRAISKGPIGVDQGARRQANFAHGGIGTNSHLCAVMMGNTLSFKPTFVAYRGSGPAITDLLAGQIDLLWDQVTNALPQVQSGNLHGIAITAPTRLAGIAQCTDDRRARHPRAQLHHVARPLCPCWHTQGHHRCP